MNNGRDCLHGRQVGKCDTCDLIKAELELQRVTAERDALAAQVKQFRLIFRSENLSQSETAIALQKMASSVDMLPEHHLAAHDAEVAKKAVQAALRMYGSTDLSNKEIISLSESYAANLNK